MTNTYAVFSIRGLIGICSLCLLGLLPACSKMPPPNDGEGLKIVRQYLNDYGGTLKVHKGLGKVYTYRPTTIYSVDIEKCYAIARDAYWCNFMVEYSTAKEGRMSSPLSLRIELKNGRYRAVVF